MSVFPDSRPNLNVGTYVTLSANQTHLNVLTTEITALLTLSLPMSPLCDQRQSANVAIMRLGHVACFSDLYYPILRHIVANKGDNLTEDLFLANKPGNGKKIVKNVIFSILKRVTSILWKIVAEWLLPASP